MEIYKALREKLDAQVFPRLPQDSQELLLGHEIHSRLGQLGVLVSLVDRTMDQMIHELRIGNLAEHETMLKANLFAEAFYLFAFRIISVTRLLSKRVFGCKQLVAEPRGVIMLRNDFIIHPEGLADPVLTHNLMFSTYGRDVYVKGARPSDENQALQDPGFRKNLAEFDAFIEAWVNIASVRDISSVGAG